MNCQKLSPLNQYTNILKAQNNYAIAQNNTAKRCKIMDTMQLNVFDLPRDNILEVLPRFSIGAKYDDAIAQFEKIINEIRLDQLPQELAGNGKSDRHTQAVFPIEIKLATVTNYDSIDDSISGIFSDNTNIPENTLNPRKHGHIEDYLVKGEKGKIYKYRRYVYLDDKKIYRHHHIPQKQVDAIATMWTRGASAKEICTALGKKYLGKSPA